MLAISPGVAIGWGTIAFILVMMIVGFAMARIMKPVNPTDVGRGFRKRQ